MTTNTTTGSAASGTFNVTSSGPVTYLSSGSSLITLSSSNAGAVTIGDLANNMIMYNSNGTFLSGGTSLQLYTSKYEINLHLYLDENYYEMLDGYQYELPEEVDVASLNDILEWILLEQSDYFDQHLPRLPGEPQTLGAATADYIATDTPHPTLETEITFDFKIFNHLGESEIKTIVLKLSELP
jgi:hypothetical protein